MLPVAGIARGAGGDAIDVGGGTDACLQGLRDISRKNVQRRVHSLGRKRTSPIDTPSETGDLRSFHQGVQRSLGSVSLRYDEEHRVGADVDRGEATWQGATPCLLGPRPVSSTRRRA